MAWEGLEWRSLLTVWCWMNREITGLCHFIHPTPYCTHIWYHDKSFGDNQIIISGNKIIHKGDNHKILLCYLGDNPVETSQYQIR